MLINDQEYVVANFAADSASDIYWRTLTTFNILKRPWVKRAYLMLAAEAYWKALNALGRNLDSQPDTPEWARRRERNVCYQEMLIPELRSLRIPFESLDIVPN